MVNEENGSPKIEISARTKTVGVVLLIAGVVLGIISYLVDPGRTSFSYLVSYMYLFSVGVGALFLVALEYAAGAVWSVFFRRICEFLAAIVPLLIILAIPLFFNLHDVFHWTHANVIASDRVVRGKVGYLNIPFLLIRLGIILIIFTIFYMVIIKNSRKQDKTPDPNLTTKNVRFSLIYIVIFAFAITIISIDWMMSIEPHWYSTIFGVYFFAGITWVSLAFTTLIAVNLKEKGHLKKVNKDHFYSLGTLMFAFTCFWGYIAFSQYMLIWIGNIPEETAWFFHRWTGPWVVISIVLIISHFFVPFFALLSYPSKTNFGRLKFISIWIMVVHFIDLYWLIMPGMNIYGQTYYFSWGDVVFPLAVLGIIILVFSNVAKKHNIVPVGDPKLERAADFRL